MAVPKSVKNADNKPVNTIREAIGIFHNAESLHEAIDELLAAGFTTEELGLLASEQVVENSLGDLYERTNDNPESTDAPAIAFVRRDTLGETARTHFASMFFVGTGGVMGGLVATAAVVASPLLVALGTVVGVGMVGAAAAAFIHQSDAEYLQQQVDEGHILLFVRIDDARGQQAMNILKRHSGLDVKMYDVPVTSDAPNSVRAINT
jgi:hypothetical protein